MELKKSDKANLEKSRGLFFEIGLLIALGITLAAFETQFAPKDEGIVEMVAQAAIEEETIPVTRQEEPPPPPPEPPRITDILEIVADDVQVDTQIHIDVDIDLDTQISLVEFDFSVEIEEEEEAIMFLLIEDKPLFNGQDPTVAFSAWVYSQIRYPPIAAENGITGRVFTEFVIDRDGRVIDVRITRGADPLLDAEALRVLRMSPNWTPGRQRDRAVRVRYTFPIVFQLQN